MVGLQIPKKSAIFTGTGYLFTAIYLAWSEHGVKVYYVLCVCVHACMCVCDSVHMCMVRITTSYVHTLSFLLL